MNGNFQQISKEKYDELGTELNFLKTKKRKEIAGQLEYAKSLGDLSENAEYHQAREEQARLEERISYLENVLKNAVITAPQSGDIVGFGSTLIVRKQGQNENKTYKIVGPEEVDMAAGKLSNHSPIGAAFIGKKRGDQVSISTPGGKVVYTVIEVK